MDQLIRLAVSAFVAMTQRKGGAVAQDVLNKHLPKDKQGGRVCDIPRKKIEQFIKDAEDTAFDRKAG